MPTICVERRIGETKRAVLAGRDRLNGEHLPKPAHRNLAIAMRDERAIVGEQRRQIERVLRKNPSLRPRTREATAEGYEDARDDAIGETELAAAVFSPECRYDRIAITTRVVEWNDLRSPQDREG